MAKVDVIKAVSESFDLVKKHYSEVLIPLVIIFLLQMGMGIPGQASNNFGSASQHAPSDTSAALAGAMTDFLAIGLTGTLIAIIAAVVLMVLLMALLERALWFYVYEHFYAILRKKKIAQEWGVRMRRHAFKALVLMLFGAILLVTVMAYPIANAYSLLSSGDARAHLSEMLLPLALPFISAIAILAIVSFFISPLWAYYAMDCLPFAESLSKSFSLVAGNIGTFVVLDLAFLALGVGAIAVSIATCCFAMLTMPLAMIFLGLLHGVALMKIKLALEKK